MNDFEYTGEFRVPEEGEQYEANDRQTTLRRGSLEIDRELDSIDRWGKRRPIMRKVEPITITSIHKCGGAAFIENCIVVKTMEKPFHMSDASNRKAFGNLLDSGRKIVYTENKEESCG